MDNFANEFMTKLDGKLSPEQMKTVLMELEMFSAEYNIEKKSTEIVTYDNTVPECYKVYLVSKKIEGLSLETLRTYKCNLDEFFQCVNKPIQLVTTNDIRIYPFTARRLRPLRWEMNCVYTYLIEHPNYSIVSLVK